MFPDVNPVHYHSFLEVIIQVMLVELAYQDVEPAELRTKKMFMNLKNLFGSLC